MKKPLLFIASLGALSLSSGALAALVNQDYIRVNATEQKSLIVNDTFNESSYAGSFNPKKWISSDNTIKQSTTADTYFYNNGTGALNTENCFLGTKKVKTFEYIQFDVRFFTETKWISFKFYKEETTATGVYSHAYDGPIGLSPTYLNTLGVSPLLGVRESQPSDYSEGSLAWATGQENNVDTWLTIRFEPINTTELKAYLFNKGESKDESKAVTFGLTSDGADIYNFQTCQFGIQAENGCQFAIDHLEYKAEEDDGVFVEDFATFKTEDSQYPLGYVQKNAASYAITGLSTLDINNGAKAGDKIVALKAVQEDTTVSQDVLVIDAKFSVSFSSSATNDECFGYVFGLPAQTDELESAGGVVEIHKNKAVLKTYANGEQTSTDSQNTVTFGSSLIDEITSEEGLSLEVRLTKSGAISLARKKNESYITVKAFNGAEIARYAGYTGFAALSDITNTIKLDNALIYNSQYYVPTTKSVTHNFSNNFFGNEGYEDFYIPYSFDGRIFAENGKLNYEACADNAFFGSAHQYDAFILDYKLCSILVGPEDNSRAYTSPTKWIGLDLSRKAKTLTEYGTYAMLFFEITPRETDSSGNPITGEYLNFFKQDSSPVDRDDIVVKYADYPIPTQMFRDIQYDSSSNPSSIPEEKYVCVRWVSDGSSISLYLKTNGESEFTWYATVSNLELNGYFALANTGFTYLQYDDFSMANTSPIYVCADNEAPETITNTETITNYDPANVDVNIEEELRVNAGGLETVFLVTTIVFGVATVGLGIGLALVLIKRKKQNG